jgi:leukotriene-A4 hydrolase
VAPQHDVFGSALHIKVGGDAGLKQGDEIIVRVEYETSPSDALAIQWLNASQTAGKKHPYLFTQCQAIHARTMVPCQDTPSVKTPYLATVTVDSALTALMSAVPTGETTSADGKHKTFSFKQAVPIPSYLIALAVGALVSRDIGPRSKVWSEAEMVDAGAFEFAETEKFISIAENLVGPYVWGRYDVLLLPPSFPYGGMENPCLTFVTPTLLAGDRSNADVVAHEISHSWTGNLVSNLTWEHFWLNEGFTMFLERKILAAIHGDKYFDFDSILGWKHLQDDIDHFGATNPLTNLMPKLENIDPDDAFSSVPYEKGFTLLVYLQQLVGGAKLFDPFFRAWIEANHYKCVTSFDFKAFFHTYFAGKVDEATLNKVDWDAWFNTPGMPIVKPDYDTSLADASNQLAARWVAGGADINSAADMDGWTAKQICMLARRIILLYVVLFWALQSTA